MLTTTPFAVTEKQDRAFAQLPDEVSLKLLDTLMESAPGFVAVFKLPDLNVIYLNSAANKRLISDPGADIAQLSLSEITCLSSLSLLNSEILPHIQLLGRWSGIFDLRDGWGSEFRATVIFAKQAQLTGDGKGYLCMYAQEQFSSADSDKTHFTDRHLLHALLNHAPDAIYFKDSFCRFVRVSRTLAKRFGLDDPSEAIGRTDFDMFSAQHASVAFGVENLVMRTGQAVVDMEEMQTFEDGRIGWCSTSRLPLRDENGLIIGTFGISRDITEQKLSEQSRREMETQLQLAQKLESIGRLAAGVAHEINTPTQFITDNIRFLTGAFAHIEAMLVQYRALRTVAAEAPACTAAVQAALAVENEVELEYLSTEIPSCLTQSLDGLARVTRIVASLKEFAHPNSPKLTPVDLNRVIETSITVSRHEWKYVAEVISELDPNLPPVPCVVDEFNQVMLNLIVNAAHAIGDALKKSGAKSGLITIRTRLEAPWAVVEVEDTGTGIPEEIRLRIFEPFFTTKAVGKGTGQGLAIVQTVVVKHHHGTIELTSEPGCGTKFTLRLPLVTPSQPEALLKPDA